MTTYPLAVISPYIGKISETFIHRHMVHLMPAATVVVARRNAEILLGSSSPFPFFLTERPSKGFRWFVKGSLFFLKFSHLSPVQIAVGDYLKKNNVQVILSEYLDQSLKWLPVAKALGIRFFAHAHGYDISISLRHPKMRKRYLQLVEADGIIAVSEVSRQRLISLGLDGTKIHVIPCGVDVPYLPPPLKRHDKQTVRCLAVGRMVAKKSPLLTLKAFNIALQSIPDMQLDFIGDGDLFESAYRFVKENNLTNHVIFHRSQPNLIVQEMMRKADIFLQHSLTDTETGDEEGLPVGILEAMANGLPVISTRHGGIPEAVVEGITGYLVNEGDYPRMAQCLIDLSRDSALQNKYGYAGWQRASNKFSWEIERSKLLALLEPT